MMEGGSRSVRWKDEVKKMENLDQFVMETAPQDYLVHCRITRHNRGLDKGLFPTYFLHMEREEGRSPVFLLAGRKRKKCTSSTYLLSTDPTDLSKDCSIANMRSNLVGTMFTVMQDERWSSSTSRPCSSSGGSTSPRGSGSPASWGDPQEGAELAIVTYKPNMLGMSGPRKMRVVLPRNGTATRGLLESYRERRTEGMVVLESKDAEWDKSLNSYVLNYHGRASQASVKNFQLCHHSSPEYIIMQLGRIETNVFNMDFRSPLSALQAFAIALSSFDCKLACE